MPKYYVKYTKPDGSQGLWQWAETTEKAQQVISNWTTRGTWSSGVVIDETEFEATKAKWGDLTKKAPTPPTPPAEAPSAPSAPPTGEPNFGGYTRTQIIQGFQKMGYSFEDALRQADLRTSGMSTAPLPENFAQYVTPTAPTDTATKDKILNWVNTQKATYNTADFAFDTREQMIEQGVEMWGENFRQFIVDTTYRELRTPDEPPYVPPAWEVYKGKGALTDKDLTEDDIKRILQEFIDEQLTLKFDPQEPWTEADTVAVEARFESMYGPLYEAYSKVATREAKMGVEEIGRVEELGITRAARNLEEALTESRASMAVRGLAFSGIREEAERKEKAVSVEQMQESREIAQRGRRGEVLGLEAEVGTEATQRWLTERGLTVPKYEWLDIPGRIPMERDIALQAKVAEAKGERKEEWLSDYLTQAASQGYNIFG